MPCGGGDQTLLLGRWDKEGATDCTREGVTSHGKTALQGSILTSSISCWSLRVLFRRDGRGGRGNQVPIMEYEASGRQCREDPRLLQVQAPATREPGCQFCLVTSAHVSTGTVNYQMLHSYEELWTAGQELKEGGLLAFRG